VCFENTNHLGSVHFVYRSHVLNILQYDFDWTRNSTIIPHWQLWGMWHLCAREKQKWI